MVFLAIVSTALASRRLSHRPNKRQDEPIPSSYPFSSFASSASPASTSTPSDSGSIASAVAEVGDAIASPSASPSSSASAPSVASAVVQVGDALPSLSASITSSTSGISVASGVAQLGDAIGNLTSVGDDGIPQNPVDRTSGPALYPKVCGAPSNPMVADASRTTELWNQYDLGSLYSQLTREAQARNWKSLDGSSTYRNIQDLVLELAGKEGVGECKEISNPNCGASGLDYGLCKQHPSVHFMYIALTNWANFLNKVYESFQSSTLSITALTSSLVNQFYTPQTDPKGLLVPIGIVNGLAGIISVAWGPIGLLGGIGAIAAAFITQAGLDRP
ncbi:MAG: hypothetical protein Q9168_004351, partial [Polycauliona sp. 1 TL-2023]